MKSLLITLLVMLSYSARCQEGYIDDKKFIKLLYQQKDTVGAIDYLVKKANDLNDKKLYEFINYMQFIITLFSELQERGAEISLDIDSHKLDLYLAAVRKNYGADNVDYARSLITVGTLIHQNPAFLKKSRAMYYYNRAYIYFITGREPESESLDALLAFYSKTGDREKVFKLYELTGKEYGENYKSESQKFVENRYGLIAFLDKERQACKAAFEYDQLMDKFIEPYGTSLSDKERFTALKFDYGNKYYSLGVQEKAKKIFLDNLKDYDRLKLPPDFFYYNTLQWLSRIYNSEGAYQKSDSLMNVTERYMIRTYGEESEQHISALIAKGFNKINIPDSIFADKNIERAYAVSNARYPGSSLSTVCKSYYGCLKYRQKDYAAAEKLYLDFLYSEVQKKSENTRSGYQIYSNLFWCYFDWGKYDKADMYANLYCTNIFKFQKEDLQNYNEETLENKDKVYGAYQALYNLGDKIPGSALKLNLLNLHLLLKGSIVYRKRLLNSLKSEVTDEGILSKFEEFRVLNRQLGDRLQKNNQSAADKEAIQKKVNMLEAELMDAIPAFKEEVQHKNNSWENIQRILSKNEAAIEFVSFRSYNKGWEDKMYAAYIFTGNLKEPVFVKCFEEKKILEYVSVLNANTIEGYYDNELYKLIFGNIEPYLQGITTMYIAPIDFLNNISFSAITIPSKGLMAGKYEIHIVESVSEIAQTAKEDRSPITNISLFGGINYNAVQTADKSYRTASTESSFEKRVNTLQLTKIREIHRSDRFREIMGTQAEITAIDSLISAIFAKKTIVRIYGGDTAYESIIKQMGTGERSTPDILHIASHGFSYAAQNASRPDQASSDEPGKGQSIFQQSEDALTRCGIAFSGANKFWEEGIETPGKENGILTAREITDLNLAKCRLVVLSACNSGVGEIKGNEGVYGFQRTFKMAGVRYIMASLWEIPDAYTADFMKKFYQYLFTDPALNIPKAFRDTQRYMYTNKINRYRWASFVLFE